MAYTPINPIIFTTAYSSALAGMNTSGRQMVNVSATTFASVAGAFAQAFDTLWGDPSTPNQLEVQSVEENVSAFFEDRQPLSSLTNPDDWTADAAEIIDVVDAAVAYFAAQGVVSPPWIGGGSGINQLIGDVKAGPGTGTQMATMQGIQTVPVAATPPVGSAVPVFNVPLDEYQIRQLTQDDIAAGFEITSFTGGSTVETGATVTDPTFAASYSSLPTSAVITNTDGQDSPHTLTTPFTAATIVGAFTRATPGAITFTLTTHQNSLVNTAASPINYDVRSFGGVGLPGATTSIASGNDAILDGGAGTLSQSALLGNVVGSVWGPFSPVGESIYLQLPAGAHTFVDGSGFPFVMTAVNTYSFTNQEGAVVSTTLWASNTLSSPFSVKVAT